MSSSSYRQLMRVVFLQKCNRNQVYSHSRSCYIFFIILTTTVLFFISSDSHAGYSSVLETLKDSKRGVFIAECRYPRVEIPENSEAASYLNSFMREHAMRSLSEFRKKVEKEHRPGMPLFSLDQEITVTFPALKLASVFISTAEYYGGTHPVNRYESHLFDLEKKVEIKLSGLFKPGANYLTRLSSLCRKTLSQKEGLDRDMIREGTTAEEANFRVFILEPDGLVIFFPEYQVASYADGPQEVKIHFEKIADLLDRNGPLGPFIK